MELQHGDHGVLQTNTKHQFGAQVTAIAIGGGNLLLASLVGPGTSVDAIRASCSMGKPLTYYSPDALKTRYDRNAQKQTDQVSTKDQRYKLFKSYLANIRQSHYILVSQQILQPNIDDGYVYTIGSASAPKHEIVGAALRACLSVAIFPAWYKWLVSYNETGSNYQERAYRITSAGCSAYYVPLGDHWEKAISHGLKTGALDKGAMHGAS